MTFDLTVLDTRSYNIQVASIADGVKGIQMVFDLLNESALEFSAGVMDDIGNSNGWVIEKTKNGFLFQLVCLTPTHGFLKGDGTIYCYKAGSNLEQIEWPFVESATLPKHCFLSKEQVRSLLAKLATATTPEDSAGFEYDMNEWEAVC